MARWEGRFTEEITLSHGAGLQSIPVNHSIGRGKTQELVKEFTIQKETLDALLQRYGSDTWSNRPTEGACAAMRGVRKTTPRPKISGRGRAQALKRRLLEQQRRPGELARTSSTSSSMKSHKEMSHSFRTVESIDDHSHNDGPDWLVDENTLIFHNIPRDQTKESLVDVMKDFGVVTHCTILSKCNEAGLHTAYVRMEQRSTCDWVLSYFNGIPFEDSCSESVSCYFALDQ